jgi:hypothetical protein
MIEFLEKLSIELLQLRRILGFKSGSILEILADFHHTIFG